MERTDKTRQDSKSAQATCSVVDMGKIAELGQAYAQFELIRSLAIQAQIRFGKHFSINVTECMSGISEDADRLINEIMKVFDATK